jgi:hypothetical protein
MMNVDRILIFKVNFFNKFKKIYFKIKILSTFIISTDYFSLLERRKKKNNTELDPEKTHICVAV